ncbi:MAG: hypothetical protein ACRC2S_09175 [Waterburya sp.]
MTNNCTAIATGNSIKSWQQFGLNLASQIYGGRDVVIAIDLTESVGLNAEGRLRLTQIPAEINKLIKAIKQDNQEINSNINNLNNNIINKTGQQIKRLFLK